MLPLNIGVVSDHMFCVITLLVSLLAMSCCDLFALFDVGGVYDDLTQMLWNLVGLGLGHLMALHVFLVMALWSR